VPHFLFIFIEVKEFLLVLNIFSRFLFVKVIIKDFCLYKRFLSIPGEFLRVGFLGDFWA
jgi:hypothetical protein